MWDTESPKVLNLISHITYHLVPRGSTVGIADRRSLFLQLYQLQK